MKKIQSLENFEYVGNCPVCDLAVDLSESGYCENCKQSFHWGECGGWGDDGHICNNCKDLD